MEDIRNYRYEEEDKRREDEQRDWNAAREENDEVPFEVPRD